MKLLWLAALLLSPWFVAFAGSSQAEDLNRALMRATCKLADEKSGATAFVLCRPVPGDARPSQTILVTAGHVLANVQGDQMTLFLHERLASGTYAKLPTVVRIRRDGKELWTRHPSADVAVLAIDLPKAADSGGVSWDLLATDEQFQHYDVHPGDSVVCLGFPHRFENGPAIFPVLRGGLISSATLVPGKTVKTFAVSLNTFEGDSGGPVYLADPARNVDGSSQPEKVGLILGLVVGQHLINEEIKTAYETRKITHRLGLAIVVHASLIRETIEQLPSGPPK